MNSKNELTQPYAPSWVDRLGTWIDQQLGPPWLYYISLGLILLMIQAVPLWVEGAYLVGKLPPLSIFFAVVAPFFLAQFHLLDNMAREALTSLQPILKVGSTEFGNLRFRITTLSARPTLLAGLLFIIVTIPMDLYWGNPANTGAMTDAPIAAALAYVTYKFVWWTFGTLVYHAIHQLKLINHILTKHTTVNLYRMGPLYAFSKLTALTAGGLALPTYGYFIGASGASLDPVALVQLFLILVLAIVVFVWPLWGIHRLLVAEQGRLHSEAAARLEAVLADLHRRIDQGDLAVMDDLNKAIDSLKTEMSTLGAIPTWPWQTETIRLLFSALALPLGLWLIQFVLERLLGA